MRRYFRSGLLSALALAAGLVLALASNTACKRQNVPQPKKIPQAASEMPTKERPVVMDTRKNSGGILFGGESGNERISIKWPEGLRCWGIGQSGRSAGAYYCTPEKKHFFSFYDSSGNEKGKVEFPRKPEQAFALYGGKCWIGDRDEAVVIICGITKKRIERPGAPPISPQVTYLAIDGTVKDLDLDVKRIRRVFFTPSDGFVVVLRDDQKCEFRKYGAKAGSIVWKKRFEDNSANIWLWPPRGGDLTISRGGKFIKYGPAGEILEEWNPKD